MDFIVAAGRDEEVALAERKCRCEELRWIADEPVGQTGGSVMGNENLYAIFHGQGIWRRYTDFA